MNGNHLRSTWQLRLLLLAALAPAASCDAIVGAGNRELNSTIVCSDDGGCTCVEGLGDCDEEPSNGCETELDSPENCGGCGVTCSDASCQAGACVCDAGRASCDDDPRTCEIDLSSDSEHCGSCERSCQGGKCENGLCKPEPVTAVGPIYSFALVDKTLFYATLGDMGMFRVELGGDAPTPFGDDMQFVNLMYHHDGTVYWTTGEAVYGTSIATGESMAVATQQAPGGRLAAGGGKIYWGNAPFDSDIAYLRRAPLMGGGPVEEITELGDIQFVFDFAVSEEHAYWNDVFQVMRTPHDKVEPVLFKNAPVPPLFMQASAEGVLFTGNPAGAYFLPYGAGNVRQLADIDGNGVIESDAQNAYFVTWVLGSEEPYKLWRAPLSGDGPPTLLAEDPYMAGSVPLAVDDKFVYWIGGVAGEVVRVAK